MNTNTQLRLTGTACRAVSDNFGANVTPRSQHIPRKVTLTPRNDFEANPSLRLHLGISWYKAQNHSKQNSRHSLSHPWIVVDMWCNCHIMLSPCQHAQAVQDVFYLPSSYSPFVQPEGESASNCRFTPATPSTFDPFCRVHSNFHTSTKQSSYMNTLSSWVFFCRPKESRPLGSVEIRHAPLDRRQ